MQINCHRRDGWNSKGAVMLCHYSKLSGSEKEQVLARPKVKEKFGHNHVHPLANLDWQSQMEIKQNFKFKVDW